MDAPCGQFFRPGPRAVRGSLIQEDSTYLLDRSPDSQEGAKAVYCWRKLSDDSSVPIENVPENNLCLTGSGLSWLMENKADLVASIIPKVRVFARTSPRQKELIIIELKSNGFYTVMCGDGTNDVGALKHSHVGVALLSSSVGEKLEKQREFMQKRRQGLFQNTMHVALIYVPMSSLSVVLH